MRQIWNNASNNDQSQDKQNRETLCFALANLVLITYLFPLRRGKESHRSQCACHRYQWYILLPETINPIPLAQNVKKNGGWLAWKIQSSNQKVVFSWSLMHIAQVFALVALGKDHAGIQCNLCCFFHCNIHVCWYCSPGGCSCLPSWYPVYYLLPLLLKSAGVFSQGVKSELPILSLSKGYLHPFLDFLGDIFTPCSLT